MEGNETGDDEPESEGEHERGSDIISHNCVDRFCLKDTFEDEEGFSPDLERRDRGVEEHIEKVLVICETNAVCNPRAVMIHFEDAGVALRAVMTSIGFRSEAALAHAHTT